MNHRTLNHTAFHPVHDKRTKPQTLPPAILSGLPTNPESIPRFRLKENEDYDFTGLTVNPTDSLSISHFAQSVFEVIYASEIERESLTTDDLSSLEGKRLSEFLKVVYERMWPYYVNICSLSYSLSICYMDPAHQNVARTIWKPIMRVMFAVIYGGKCSLCQMV
jgi:hypothetical protein